MNVIAAACSSLRAQFLTRCIGVAMHVAGYLTLALFDLRVAVGVMLVEWAGNIARRQGLSL